MGRSKALDQIGPGARVSLVGIELVTVEARVVVASIATYLGYAGVLSDLEQFAGSQASSAPHEIGKTFPTWTTTG